MQTQITPAGDKYIAPQGDVYVDLIGHGSVMINWKGKVIQVDPYSQVADYATLPKADLILITHAHGDHLDPTAIGAVKKDDTKFITSAQVAQTLKQAQVLNNGQQTKWDGITIQAVPAYNLVHKMEDGQFWHPKSVGNGYVLHFGDFRVYLAGDTENIPEMADIAGVDVAFLPKNLPYTMTDEMFIDAAKRLNPHVLYPYHYSQVDKIKLQSAVGPDIQIK